MHVTTRRAAAFALAIAAAGCSDDSETASSASSASGTGASTAAGTGGDAATSSASASGSSASASSSGDTGGGGGGATGGGGSGSGGGGTTGCVGTLGAGHHQLPCDGGIVYEVEVPAACTQRPCGLIVDIHGFTMNADSEDENTGMRALGQQHGYVVVQPTAPGTPPGWDQPSHAPLVFAFLKDVALSLGTDPARVHAMGFSQGGGMTLRLICQHADFFASVSPIGAITGCEFSGANMPSEEVDILQVHGHDDLIVSFTGVAVPQRDAALAAWSFGQGTSIEQDADHQATRWTTNSGTVFEFWEHDYQAEGFLLGGHCVPGGDDLGGVFAYSCVEPGTLVYGELAMQFFLDHPGP
jgi:poly(3-hydroxybutyrate) depolymerase